MKTSRNWSGCTFEKEGFEVVSFSRGDSALTAFKSNPPALLLLDIMLPGMDGWQVCRAIRQISSIPIIMLSAKDETLTRCLVWSLALMTI